MYMFSKEINYILEHFDKYSYLDIRDKLEFFRDIYSIKALDKELGMAIELFRDIVVKIGKWFILSSAILSLVLLKEKPMESVDYIITVIVSALYFTIGKSYVNI